LAQFFQLVQFCRLGRFHQWVLSLPAQLALFYQLGQLDRFRQSCQLGLFFQLVQFYQLGQSYQSCQLDLFFQ
jgi:hypothetical protein